MQDIIFLKALVLLLRDGLASAVAATSRLGYEDLESKVEMGEIVLKVKNSNISGGTYCLYVYLTPFPI